MFSWCAVVLGTNSPWHNLCGTEGWLRCRFEYSSMNKLVHANTINLLQIPGWITQTTYQLSLMQLLTIACWKTLQKYTAKLFIAATQKLGWRQYVCLFFSPHLLKTNLLIPQTKTSRAVTVSTKLKEILSYKIPELPHKKTAL